MDRDIKFRGRSNNTWVYGFYCYKRNEDIHLICGNGAEIPVHGKTVGQCTGFKDKNSKEIYEGDIIQFTWESNSCWGKAGTYLGYIKFDKGSFQVAYLGKLKEKRIKEDAEEYDDISSLMYWSEDVMIIKNIYDNPELLEG
jgi:uncharacterized phage protein (TIGR01671 family)